MYSGILSVEIRMKGQETYVEHLSHNLAKSHIQPSSSKCLIVVPGHFKKLLAIRCIGLPQQLQNEECTKIFSTWTLTIGWSKNKMPPLSLSMALSQTVDSMLSGLVPAHHQAYARYISFSHKKGDQIAASPIFKLKSARSVQSLF